MYTSGNTIEAANASDFDQIIHHISDFELDSRELDFKEFLIVRYNKKLVGFGRIRRHTNCYELCSLGVVEPERHKGIGSALVKALVSLSLRPLYLVCIIPEFFEPLGFKTVNEYPAAMKDKLDYCTNELVVAEKYVVMRFYELSEV